ncbi:hypothetical protein [Streptomyces sp. NPDC056600]|uniref:hypothetical protein n=1 Tax=Streptomyces sp. NPDC056600 TaxID=3345874 RepID=UPI0036B77A31
MRKLPVLVTTLAVAGLGLIVPATSAQAAGCATAKSAALSGYMYAYDNVNCGVELGHASGDDSNWGDSGGSFQGGDTNKATSILNKGNSYEVAFYNGTRDSGASGGGNICLSRAEGFASDLTNDYFNNGNSANNSISSHAWSSASNCSKWAV